MRYSALIVDDEPLARAGLRDFAGRDPELATVHEAKNGREAVMAIRERRPDLVFLDVQMPEMDGFGVIREIGAANMPAIVFVTAHDEYALRAFEINAIDYLLKPVTEDRFSIALGRAKARLAVTPADEAGRQILGLLETILSPRSFVRRLAVRSAGKIVFVDASDIDWIQAAENYVELHVGPASHLLHVPLTVLEKSLDPERFLRIHRSIVVQLARIQSLQPALHGEYVVTLKSGQQFHSGRTYSERLRSLTINPF